MKHDALHMALLYDYYGEVLTEKQKLCFDLYYNQDLSLAEIAENEGISRQGVHDSLARAEAVLDNLEEKIGCIARARSLEKSLQEIRSCADILFRNPDPAISSVAEKITAALNELKE